MPGRLLYLSSKDLDALDFSMRECIDITEETLCQHSLGKVELPPKAGFLIFPETGSAGWRTQAEY